MARSKSGAPAGNKNAAKTGLYIANPSERVIIAPDAGLDVLAQGARDLADAALWIAESLNSINLTLEDGKLVSLYAAVSQELNQLAGELAGEAGIKPASLGTLSDAQYELLMQKQAKALSLTLSQCMGTWKHIRDREEIRKDVENSADQTPVLEMPAGLIITECGVPFLNPALDYLAAHMRAAKRMMRDMAANRAWRHHGDHPDEDLSERMLKAIPTKTVGG
jgi:hypothetical protein